MADVMVTFKVMPESIDVDLGRLEEKVKNAVFPERIVREPIVFGIVALKVTKLMPDAGGYLEDVEKKLREVDGVGEVEVEEMGRSL